MSMLKEFTVYLKIENLAVDQVHKKKYTIIPGQSLTLGRSKEANIVLIDENVSRVHARFSIAHNKLFIEDLKSGNGTYVNDEKILKREIRKGQLIVIGGFEISISQVEDRPSDVNPDDIIIEAAKEEQQTDSEGLAAAAKAKAGDRGAEGHKLSIQSDKLNELAYSEGLKGGDPWEGRMNAKGMVDIIKEVILDLVEKKIDFFHKHPFVGTPRNSLIMMAAITGSVSFLQIMLGSASILTVLIVIFTMAFTLGGVYLTAFIEDKLKKWMGASGGFKNYLRFGVVMAVIGFPISVLAQLPVVGGIIGLLSFAVMILGIYGFYLRFKPNLVRYIVVIVIATFINIVAVSKVTVITTPIAALIGYSAAPTAAEKTKEFKEGQLKAREALLNQD